MRIAIEFILVVAGFLTGCWVGKTWEQKLLAESLAKFSEFDADARSMVNRCYHSLTAGVKAELDKLLKR